MGKRHLARQTALQLLYADEFLHEGPLSIANRLLGTGHISEKSWSPFCRQLVLKTLDEHQALDAEITKVLANWRIERLSKVDLIILRLALCEMREFPDVPLRVTLNEYIELAKQFGTDDSAAFVNGILDRLAKQFPGKDFDPGDEKSED